MQAQDHVREMMKRQQLYIPWVFFLMTAIALSLLLFRGVGMKQNSFIHNHILNSTIYSLAGAAAHGDTNGVIGVLNEIWVDSHHSSSNILAACIDNRSAVVQLVKPEHFKEDQGEEQPPHIH